VLQRRCYQLVSITEYQEPREVVNLSLEFLSHCIIKDFGQPAPHAGLRRLAAMTDQIIQVSPKPYTLHPTPYIHPAPCTLRPSCDDRPDHSGEPYTRKNPKFYIQMSLNLSHVWRTKVTPLLPCVTY
jgi:hypothetical protein